jgi:hypothetical protein
MLIFTTPSKRGFGLDVHSAVNESTSYLLAEGLKHYEPA